MSVFANEDILIAPANTQGIFIRVPIMPSTLKPARNVSRVLTVGPAISHAICGCAHRISHMAEQVWRTTTTSASADVSAVTPWLIVCILQLSALAHTCLLYTSDAADE